MDQDSEGCFRTVVTELRAGNLYKYILDGVVERPDPASRLQPEGVHGPSMTVDLSEFPRSGRSWQNHPLDNYIIYELHIGTFTPGGTFEAAIERIPYLRELGVTAVELMPVAQFPGERNWGYDGVYPYAVQSSYGGPGELINLIDALHGAGLAVILDVVYNHLGPEGNYLRDFGPYFTDKYQTPWGDAINYDGPESQRVRDFFIGNALYWLFEFGFDALRLDAVHGIFDKSPVHILKEMKQAVMSMPGGKGKYLIAESDLNETCLVDPPEKEGYGLDAQWNDDFHHCLHTLLTGESDGYYMDFGSTEALKKAYSEGFVFTGQFSGFRGRQHGTPSRHVPPGKLIVHSQTHDQVGNRMMGDRLSASLPQEKLRFAAAAVILSPYVPLIFMGEEYAEDAPFQYFISHSDPSLVEAVRKGRIEEFSSFRWKGVPPDPADKATFLGSKLNIALAKRQPNAGMLEFYRKLIRIRQQHPALASPKRQNIEVIQISGSRTIIVAIWDNVGTSMILEVLCFENKESVSFSLPREGRWPKIGAWELLIDSSMRETPGTSVRIEDRVTVGPISLSLFEHIS